MSGIDRGVTAAVLVIGDEILSGRTKDQNIGYIADYLSKLGIDLLQARIVPDNEVDIIDAVNALRARYDYVFTTGGIGPTHDDITAQSIARAFGVAFERNPRAVAMLRRRYAEKDLNEARLRMAMIPAGADLIDNPLTAAPGFRIGNVIVMAGVPAIMQAMLDHVAPQLQTGTRVVSETIDVGTLPEGIYTEALTAIASTFPSLSIGSYPKLTENGFRNQIVIRGKDAQALTEATEQVRTMALALTGDGLP